MSKVKVAPQETLHDDERLLMARLSKADPAALEELYDRYSPIVCTLAMRILGNRGEAEEITLETFLQLWNQAAKFDPVRGSLASWLLTITRNHALERLRSRGPLAAHREPIELAYFGGLSYLEIAARTGQPLEVIRSSIAQSVMKLRSL